MKALITGGSGFVGSYLKAHLIESGYDVAVSCDISNGNGVDNYSLDILDKGGVSEVISACAPDIIYHLAAQSSVLKSWENPEETVDVNIKGALNILETLKKTDFKGSLILIGSSEEYGYSDYSKPVKEETALKPGNIYAATKAMQEMLGYIYYKAFGIRIIATRSFNHIGAGQSPLFVVSDFCKQAAEIEKGIREPVIKVGNLNVQRDFTDVRDVVRAYRLLGEKGKAGEVYNVGSGNAVSIRSILDKIISLSESDIKVETDKSRLRPTDIPIIEADIEKLQKDTCWQPEIKVSDTIADMLNYWRSEV